METREGNPMFDVTREAVCLYLVTVHHGDESESETHFGTDI